MNDLACGKYRALIICSLPGSGMLSLMLVNLKILLYNKCIPIERGARKGKAKMKILKKIGWFFASLLPLLVYIALTAATPYAFLLASAAWSMVHGIGDKSVFVSNAINQYLENPLLLTLTCQWIALPIYGLWYYFAYGRRKRPEGIEKTSGKKIAVIVLAGVLLQFLVSGVLSLLEHLKPSLMQGYIDLMERGGLTETTWLLLFSTAIMAPLVEELLCRGITLRIAGKVSTKFWVANCIQALVFGIIHWNLVQGIYAFFMGLVLGYVYGKYRKLWACMLLHGVINLSSCMVDGLFLLVPDRGEAATYSGSIMISLILLGICYKYLGKIMPLDREGEET